VGRILIREVIDLSSVSYKFREKNSSYDIHVRNKCGGRKECQSSQFIHHRLKSSFLYDPFSHVAKLHSYYKSLYTSSIFGCSHSHLGNIFFNSVDTVSINCGGVCTTSFLFCIASNFF